MKGVNPREFYQNELKEIGENSIKLTSKEVEAVYHSAFIAERSDPKDISFINELPEDVDSTEISVITCMVHGKMKKLLEDSSVAKILLDEVQFFRISRIFTWTGVENLSMEQIREAKNKFPEIYEELLVFTDKVSLNWRKAI